MIGRLELSEEAEVVVVGAGLSGLAAAKTYLQCAPETELIVLDANHTLGGTWARERLYPGIRTNNLYGTFEFPDFPFTENYGVKPGEHIPGHAVHQYLRDYCDHFKITPCLRQNSKVSVAEKQGDGRWSLQVTVAGTTPARVYSLICSKLIVATGLTSQPESIHVAGQENFQAPIINSFQLPREGVRILRDTPDEEKRITVMGGGKSAYDAVYMFAKEGFTVNWIIRKSGHGPTWMSPAILGTGSKKQQLEDVPATRALTWFCPALLGRQDTYTSRFLHGTSLGNRLVSSFFDSFGDAVISQTGLKEHPELQKLIPEERVFWYATSLAILNYEQDFHDFIRNGQVSVYREDIKHLSPNRVDLIDGTQLPSPAGLITATAWKYEPNIDIQPSSIRAQLGIPISNTDHSHREIWSDLVAEADEYILNKFPMLAEGPTKLPARTSTKAQGVDIQKNEGPYRLFRFLAPPGLTGTNDRSIVFQGYMANLRNPTRNELSALWIYAYMNYKLDILDNPNRADGMYNDAEKVMHDTALQTEYWKLRYPWGFGDRWPDMTFEQIAYNDLLLTDLGLDWRRKRGWFGWIRELFEPYHVGDYRAVVQEWMAKQK